MSEETISGSDGDCSESFHFVQSCPRGVWGCPASALARQGLPPPRSWACQKLHISTRCVQVLVTLHTCLKTETLVWFGS